MNLDNIKMYKKLDASRVAESIKLLPDQIKQVLEESRSIKIPKNFGQSTKIVVNGMGGSSTGARIVKALFLSHLKVPFNIEPGYILPDYVDKDTLCIIVSYSGTTEEPLSIYQEAKKRGAKILAVAENKPGNGLQKLMAAENIPGYIFTPANNPSDQPRLGVGYTMFGIIALLMRAGFLRIKEEDVKEYINRMKTASEMLEPEKLTKNNPAKKIAAQLKNKNIVFVGAEHLEGNLYSLRNQTNESAKQFAAYLSLPDLNHYAMEGLVNPAANRKNMLFLFFDSALYHLRVQMRAKLTKQVVAKNGIKEISCKLQGKTKLEQAFEMLQLGSWISYYLSILNNADPVKIPWVDWFKKKLG
jgi:glucose/mannose-6-phosphate isomerase